MNAQSQIAKYRKQIAYSKGLRKVNAMADLAQALISADLTDATAIAQEAVLLAQKLLGRLDPGDRRIVQYEIAYAKTLFARCNCHMSAMESDKVEKLLEEALVIWERHEQWRQIIEGLQLFSDLLSDQYNIDRALEKNRQAKGICEQLSMNEYLSDLYAQEAILLYRSGKSEATATAVEYALAHLKHRSESGLSNILARISFAQQGLTRYTEARQTLEHAVASARKEDNKLALLKLLYNLSALIFLHLDDEDFRAPLEEASALAIEIGNRSHQALLHEVYGVRTMRRGEYDRAITELSKALAVYRSLDQKNTTARILAWLGLIHFELGADELGEAYLADSAKLLAHYHWMDGATVAYRIILQYAPHHCNLEELAELLRQKKREAEVQDDRSIKVAIGINLGVTLEKMELHVDARQEYLEALEDVRKVDNPCVHVEILRLLGLLEERFGSGAEAREYFNNALAVSAKCREWQTHRSLLASLAAFTERRGEFEVSLNYRKEMNLRELKIFQRQSSLNIDRMLIAENAAKMRMQIEELDSESADLHKQTESARLTLALLQTQEQEYQAAYRRIIKNVELNILSKAQSNTTAIRTIMTEIQDAMNEGDTTTNAIESHPEELSAIQNLRHRYPALAPVECKVCIAILDGLSNAEIAKHLNVTLRAIENYRYRIRKKLALTPKQNLAEYLGQLKMKN